MENYTIREQLVKKKGKIGIVVLNRWRWLACLLSKPLKRPITAQKVIVDGNPLVLKMLIRPAW